MSELDIFLADCPARTTLALIGDAWSVVVIMALGLERNGLVEREARMYALTELGASLLGVVGALAGWAEEHTDELLGARSPAA